MTLTKEAVLKQLNTMKRIVEDMPEGTRLLSVSIGVASYIHLYTGVRDLATADALILETRDDPRREFLELRVHKAGIEIFELQEKKAPLPAQEHRERQVEGASPS